MIYSDNELVHQIKETQDESALLEIIDRHSGIFYKTVSDYAPYSKTGSIKDEFYERRDAMIYNAVESFDESRDVKFSTWLGNKTRYSCLSERIKQSKIPKTEQFCNVSDLEVFETDETPFSLLAVKDSAKEVLDFIYQRKGKNPRDIFEKRYFGNGGRGMNFKDIGDEMGFSTQNVNKIHNEVIEYLKKYFFPEKV